MLVPGDAPTTVVVMLVADGRQVIVARVDAREPDLALVDALVRLHLGARRRGWRVRLGDVPEALRALLELVGLDEVLSLQACGQPELGEQLGVEEVVQPGDPPG